MNEILRRLSGLGLALLATLGIGTTAKGATERTAIPATKMATGDVGTAIFAAG